MLSLKANSRKSCRDKIQQKRFAQRQIDKKKVKEVILLSGLKKLKGFCQQNMTAIGPNALSVTSTMWDWRQDAPSSNSNYRRKTKKMLNMLETGKYLHV